MMATMIKEYAKKYIEEVEEKPKTEEDNNLEDATNYFKTWSTDKIAEVVEPTTPTLTSDSGEWEETMTAEDLKRILEQDEITEEEINKLAIYLRKKKNKRKRNLLREIREKFKF